MKKIIIPISIFILLIGCKNNNEIFLSQDYNSVYKCANKNDKNIFIDFYTSWCGSCKGYDEFIFSDSLFQTYLKEDFYSLKLDAEAEENKIVIDRYKIHAYPTIIIADSEGNEINRIVGYFGNKPKYYIELIDNILSGKEAFIAYKDSYLMYPDSIELARDIAIKLLRKDEFKNIIDFCSIISENTQNTELLFESVFFKGIAEIRDKNINSPNTLLGLLEDNDTLSAFYEENIYIELVGYYKNQTDDYEQYSLKLLEKYPDNLYYNRKFIEYLYDNKKKFDIADKFVEYYKSKSNDHWAAYLVALSKSSKGDIEGGSIYFDNWLIENESTFDNSWPFFYFVEYSSKFNTRIDKAIDIAYKIENSSCDKATIRINLAKLLHEKGKNEKAIEKLKEVIPMINSSKEKGNIDRLIKEYSM